MKSKLLFLLAFIPFFVFSQDIESEEVTLIKEKAKNYFKEVYVENTFKDPYSYELLKITARPVSLQEKLENEISSNERDLIRNDTTRSSEYSYEKKKLALWMKSLKKAEKRKEKDPDNYNRYLRYYQESLFTLSSLRNEYEQLRTSDKIAKELKANPSIDKNAIAQYIIQLDCYANNSYGNKVLGKYAFRINIDGEVVDSVLKMN